MVTKLKLGTHMPTGLMYRVYQNQGQGPITLGVTSLDRFYNLPFIKKNFVTDFSRTMKVVKLKLGTHMDNGLMYCVYQNQEQGPITLRITSFDRFYNLP